MSRRVIIYCMTDAKCFWHPLRLCVGRGRAETGGLPGRAVAIPGVPFALPAEAGTVLPTGEHSIRGGNSPTPWLCVPVREGREHFYFSSNL